METINLSRPNQTPIDGDQIKIIHINGMTETIYYWTPIEPTPNSNPILTPLELLNRFTAQEAKNIIKLSKSDEDVELWWVKYNKASFISLLDPQTIAGIQTLEAIGVLAAGRANEILNF